MARGRMINQAICMDKRVHELSDDTSRLAYTWLVTFADCEGRTHGDPAIVKSLVFPRRDSNIDAAQMEAYIREWAGVGLIVWYECKGDMWIWFPAFEKNQLGLRKDREPESIIPQYIDGAEDCRKIAGRLPEDCRKKSGQKKRKEVNSVDADGVNEPPSKKSERDKLRAALEEYFSELTNIPKPSTTTEKQRRAAGTHWYAPLREMAERTDWDEEKSRLLISQAIERLRKDRLTISSPNSILKTFIAIAAESGGEPDVIRL